jgi:hypothetical protein
MNKTFLRNLSIALGLFFAPLAFASTVDLSPATVNIEPGKTFTVQVYINPQSNTYSSKVELKYPADLLQVSSFVINDSWMALKQSGYDAMDNVNGTLLKSGGYPGGFTSKILFGTVTFSAVKAGSATISVGSNTNIPNTSNVNTLTVSPSTVVSIIAPVIVQQQTTTTEKVPETTSTTKVTQQTTQPTTQLTQEVEEEPAQQEVTEEDNSSEAQASLASTSSAWGNLWGWLLALVVIGLVVYFIYRKNKKK